MQIEEITQAEIEQIAISVKDQLRKLADEKFEKALIRELNASDKSEKEKLREYLFRTPLRHAVVSNAVLAEGVENRYLEKELRIHRHKLKQVRDELKNEGAIKVFTDTFGVLRMRLK